MRRGLIWAVAGAMGAVMGALSIAEAGGRCHHGGYHRGYYGGGCYRPVGYYRPSYYGWGPRYGSGFYVGSAWGGGCWGSGLAISASFARPVARREVVVVDRADVVEAAPVRRVSRLGIPYGFRTASGWQSPWSRTIVSNRGVSSGQVLYDPVTGQAFRAR